MIADAPPSQHGYMTTSHHIQTSAALHERTPKHVQWLHDLGVSALMIALVLGVAFAASWLLPLELVVPRPR